MTKIVFCLADSEEHARSIVHRLQTENFSTDRISILLADQQGKIQENKFNTPYGTTSTVSNVPFEKKSAMGVENATKAPEGATTGAITGGILGGSLGLLAGIGSLAIPGVGPFIAAGAIMSALAGSALGGSVGMIIGGLIGMGIPEYEAERYEAGVMAGKVLVSVEAETSEEVDRVKELFTEEGAHDLSTSWDRNLTR